MGEYDQYLSEFVYEKIWSELPATEKRVMSAIADSEDNTVKSIREIAKMDSSKFSVYRERLIDRGLIDGLEYGHVYFTLPRFDVFVSQHERLM